MWQPLIALDQLINTLIPPYCDAWADETLSSRCWRNGRDGGGWAAARAIIDAICWLDPQHCFSSYVAEFERKQLPNELRKNANPL